MKINASPLFKNETPEIRAFHLLQHLFFLLPKLYRSTLFCGFTFLQKRFELNQVFIHRLAGVDTKELCDGVTQCARWRHVVHLNSHARAAIPILVEANKTSMLNWESGHSFPDNQFVRDILNDMRLDYSEKLLY